MYVAEQMFLLHQDHSCNLDGTLGKVLLTRLHSSRMRTARLLTVSLSMHCARGDAWSRGVPALGGLPAPGELVGIPACTEVDPPVNKMTDRQV